ncbi:MAG: HEPN domain-containing protein [Alphaproteobacteria bacterium]
MTNALALAVDYLRRSRLRVRAIEVLIEAGDHPDAVRESQETVELAIKALLKLVGLSYPRAHDVSRLLREPLIEGRLLDRLEIERIEQVSKALRRDRELSFYGDEDVVPLEYYEIGDAKTALKGVLEVVGLVSQAFKRNGTAI